MLPEDEKPEYTPLPLPDPHSVAWAVATAKPPLPFGRRVLRCFIVLCLLGFAAAAVMVGHYWKKAGTYDMEKIAFSQQGSVVRDREGEVIGRLFALDRRPVKINELPGHFIDALIATEDSRFFEHPGFDPMGIARAAFANLRAGGIREGGSTITQQLARFRFGLRGRTIDRKLTEIALALRIETIYRKHDILEHYLNYIYFGSGYWGVGAAARGYFGKHVSELSVGESAMLCGIIKSPSSYSPYVNPQRALRERDNTIRKMAHLALLDAGRAARILDEELALAPPEVRRQRPKFLLARIQKEVRAIAKERDLPLEGLLVDSSVDSYLQRAAAGYLDHGLTLVERDADYPHSTYEDYRASKEKPASGNTPPYLQGATIIVHNGTGEVLAAIGGRDFSESEYDRAFDARRPAGSAFLPLVYAAAFEQPGIGVHTELTDAPMDNRQVMVGGTQGVLGEWGRESFAARYEGQVSAALALLDSRNAATVELANRAGMPAIRDLAARSGIASPLRDYPSTFLGQSELTLAEMAHAYTMFPNLGTRAPELRLVTRIFGPEGDLLYEAPPRPQMEPVVSELTAAQINGILHAGFYVGSNRAAYQKHGLEEKAVAGKGGTTHGFTDAWFVGYNNVITCAVWVGFDTPREIHPKAFSRNVALPIWVDLMNALPKAPLPLPAHTQPVSICMRSGQLATPGCVDHFADGKPYHTGIKLPFAANLELPAPCAHHHAGRSLYDHQLADAGNDGDSSPGNTPPPAGGEAEKSSPGPKVIPSRSPLVIGPDPYAALNRTFRGL